MIGGKSRSLYRFVEEEHLSRQGRLCGEWCMGLVLKNAKGFSGQRDRGDEFNEEGFYLPTGPCAPEEPPRCARGCCEQPLDVRMVPKLSCLCGLVTHS